jgi:hypothetical protein
LEIVLEEQWKDIPGFEGRYQVSDLGRVKSLSRPVRHVSKAGKEYFPLSRERILRPGDCRGYLIINLPPKGTIAIQLLVARAFTPGRADGLEVNHIDGDKKNNNAANLEWVTRRENLLHAVNMGLIKSATPVVINGVRYPSISQASKMTGIHEAKVSRLAGRGWASRPGKKAL